MPALALAYAGSTARPSRRAASNFVAVRWTVLGSRNGPVRRRGDDIDIDDLVLPRDVEVDESWPPILSEMADHIGAYSALRVCEEFGGQDVYIPLRADRSPFKHVISAAGCKTMAHVYGRERLAMPCGRWVIVRAKRAGIVAAIRAGTLTVSAGARILKMKRCKLSTIVNQTDEGVGVEPTKLPEPRMLVALRYAAAIASAALVACGASPEAVAETTARILDIRFNPTSLPIGVHHAQPED